MATATTLVALAVIALLLLFIFCGSFDERNVEEVSHDVLQARIRNSVQRLQAMIGDAEQQQEGDTNEEREGPQRRNSQRARRLQEELVRMKKQLENNRRERIQKSLLVETLNDASGKGDDDTSENTSTDDNSTTTDENETDTDIEMGDTSTCQSHSSNDDHDDDNNNEDDDANHRECTICLEPYCSSQPIARAKTRTCVHQFHEHCIVEWLQNHDNCPICRNDILVE